MPEALPPKLIDLLREMRAAGVSINGLCEATGISNRTIIKYTSTAQRTGVCPCGRPADHAGHCAHRTLSSPGVQAARATIGERSRKWSVEADDLLRREWPRGATLAELTPRVNAILGRTDITEHAVEVRIGQLKVYRQRGAKNPAISAARKAYWVRWRAGLVVHGRATGNGADPVGCIHFTAESVFTCRTETGNRDGGQIEQDRSDHAAGADRTGGGVARGGEGGRRDGRIVGR